MADRGLIDLEQSPELSGREVQVLLRRREIALRALEPHLELAERPPRQRLRVEPLHLDARAVREHLEDGGPARLLAHRSSVERREVTERLPACAPQWHAEIAARFERDEVGVLGEEDLDVVLVEAEVARDDLLARRAGQRVLDVRAPIVAVPEGDRPHPLGDPGELGDEGILDTERLREVLHQVTHEVEARLVRGRLDDVPEGQLRVPVAEDVRRRSPLRQARSRAGRHRDRDDTIPCRRCIVASLAGPSGPTILDHGFGLW